MARHVSLKSFSIDPIEMELYLNLHLSYNKEMVWIRKVRSFAFTLLELMMVVAIMGILAVIGVPSYKEYVTNSKLAESYSIMGAMSTGQISYFNEHGEFFNLPTPNPTYIASSMQFLNQAVWGNFGYPVPVGSNVRFSYAGFAGKIVGGVSQTVSTKTGNSFSDLTINAFIRAKYGSTGGGTPTGVECNNVSVNLLDYGVTPELTYDWVLMTAIGDLNSDQSSVACTAVLQLIEANAASDRKAAKSGLVLLNKGR